jgi:hypothetical protein
MALRYLLIATAVLAAANGIAFLALPAQLWLLYDVHLDTAGQLQARLLGAANLGIGLLVWFSRGIGPGTERAVARGLLAWVVIDAVVVGFAAASGVTNALGWVIVAFDALLAAGYTYFLVTGPRTGTRSEPPSTDN